MDISYFKIIFTVLITMFGWFVTHRFNSDRDHDNKKREVRINYLTEAYFLLEDVFCRHGKDIIDRLPKLEKAIATIQLLGTDKQRNMAKKLAFSVANKQDADIEPLIQNLRKMLRDELDLPDANETVTYLRYGESPKLD